MTANRDERIVAVLDNLTSLIVFHASLLASEQHSPRSDADRSDEIIKEEREWVKELRAIRERFENLVVGIGS